MKISCLMAAVALFSAVLPNSLCAQFKFKVGQVTDSEVRAIESDFDPKADVEVLESRGDYRLTVKQTQGLVLRVQRYQKLKFYTDETHDYANVEIFVPRSMDDGWLGDFRAMAHNLVGNDLVEVKVKTGDMLKEKIDDNWNRYKISIPQVKKGTVVEITYDMFNTNIADLPDWNFQGDIPVRFSEVKLTFPEGFGLTRNITGYHDFEVSDPVMSESVWGGRPVQTKALKWTARDLPAFVEEKYMPSKKDAILSMSMDVSFFDVSGFVPRNFFSDWDQFDATIYEDSRIANAIKSTRIFRGVDLNEDKDLSQREIATAGLAHVREVTSWDGRMGIYPSCLMRNFEEETEANAAAMNLAFIRLMGKHGIEAAPLLLSTRGNGIVPIHIPVPSKFNYLISYVKIDSTWVAVDAAASDVPLGELPLFCLNNLGRALIDGKGQWIELHGNERRMSSIMMQMNLTQEGNYDGKVSVDLKSVAAREYRQRQFDEEPEIEDEDVYAVETTEDEEWKFTNVEATGLDDINEPIKVTADIEWNATVEEIDGDLILTPIGEWGITENPFSEEHRLYPADIACPIQRTIIIMIGIPEGFSIEGDYEPIRYLLPNSGGSFTHAVEHLGQMIKVTSILDIRQRHFIGEEYVALSRLFDYVTSKHSESIVLVEN